LSYNLNFHDSVPWHIHCTVLESEVLSPLAAMMGAYRHGAPKEAYRLRYPWWLKFPWHIHCTVLESEVLSPLAAMGAYRHGGEVCAKEANRLRYPWWLKFSQESVLLRARIEPK